MCDPFGKFERRSGTKGTRKVEFNQQGYIVYSWTGVICDMVLLIQPYKCITGLFILTTPFVHIEPKIY